VHPGIVASRTPDKAAVVTPAGERLTYGELERESHALAQEWHARGLRRGDVVALLLTNRPHFFCAAWAAQRSGLYYVAIPAAATPDDIAYVLEDAEAKAFVADAALVESAAAALRRRGSNRSLPTYTTGAAVAGFEPLPREPAAGPAVPYDAVEGGDMLYTSGTTGRPKGVKPPLAFLPLGNDPRRTERAQKLYGFDESSVFLIPAPLYHAAPLRFGMTALRLGSTIVLLPKFDAHAALDALATHGVTHSQWVPTMFNRLLALPEGVRAAFRAPSHRLAMHSGGPCSIDLKRRMIAWWGPILYEYYSGSESVGFTHADSHEWLAHPGTVGKPLGCTIHVVDESGRELPPGETGTIYFESAHRLAYHNDPKKTSEAVDERGWATMGDIGYVDAEGYVYLTDRRAFTIVTGGVNVYPREIEIALESHPRVIEAAAFGVPDADLGERVHAVVAVSSPEAADGVADELRAFVRERLAGFKVPKAIELRAELPHLASGKLDKRGLRAAVIEALSASPATGASVRAALLVALAIKGFAKPDALAAAAGVDTPDVERALDDLETRGEAERTKIGWRLRPPGTDAAREALAAERALVAHADLAATYERFCVLNDRFKSVIMAWQMRRIGEADVPNDHTDAAYDAAVMRDIAEIDGEIAPILAWLAERVPRTAPYRQRFAGALERARGGNLRFVAAPLIDSYHTVWFELHEDLIRLSGTTREAEAAAGRGA
jgi:acyl-CoA synthetase (AMP-forming)/AMP-acid ligase II